MHTIPPERLLPPLRDPLFDALREELHQHETPSGVRKELMAAFAKQTANTPWWRRLGASGWGLIGCGVGGVTALCLLLVVMLRAPAQDEDTLTGRIDDGAAFIALDSLERIEQDPAPHMLATMVPRTSLAPLGMAVNPENAGDMVRAEMLVGADGSPLALRLASQ